MSFCLSVCLIVHRRRPLTLPWFLSLQDAPAFHLHLHLHQVGRAGQKLAQCTSQHSPDHRFPKRTPTQKTLTQFSSFCGQSNYRGAEIQRKKHFCVLRTTGGNFHLCFYQEQTPSAAHRPTYVLLNTQPKEVTKDKQADRPIECFIANVIDQFYLSTSGNVPV